LAKSVLLSPSSCLFHSIHPFSVLLTFHNLFILFIYYYYLIQDHTLGR
jgi:hypothetical protein